MKGLAEKSPKELIFAGSCELLLISIFLPYMTIVVDYNGTSNVRTFSIFPSITGFAMLLIAVGGVLMILAGMRRKVILLSAANTILFITRLFADKSSASNFKHTIDAINSIENVMLNGNRESIAEWWYESGYFCMLISTILLLGVGAWCFFEKKETVEEY